jgi:hypothetical protein
MMFMLWCLITKTVWMILIKFYTYRPPRLFYAIFKAIRTSYWLKISCRYQRDRAMHRFPDLLLFAYPKSASAVKWSILWDGGVSPRLVSWHLSKTEIGTCLCRKGFLCTDTISCRGLNKGTSSLIRVLHWTVDSARKHFLVEGITFEGDQIYGEEWRGNSSCTRAPHEWRSNVDMFICLMEITVFTLKLNAYVLPALLYLL